MENAIISVVAERLTAVIEEQIRNEINLVRGVEKEVLDLSYELRKVQNVLDDAERRGFNDKSIRGWLKRLEDASYEMDDVLDEWNISRIKFLKQQQDSSSVAPPQHKVCPFIPFPLCLCLKKIVTRRDIALKIKDVKAQLDVILKEKNKYNFLENEEVDSVGKLRRVTTSFVEIVEVTGRDIDRDNLVSKIISQNASQGEQLEPIRITSIVGTGGIGKTTLAQLVYNDSRVKACFPLRMWICVSDPFDEAKIAREVVKNVQGSAPSTDELQGLLELLTECISRKKFLLVLDDVWNGDDTKWGPLKNSLKFSGAVGSRILVTTRNERVAKNIGATEIYHLGQLSDDVCCSVLRRIAFSERSEEIYKGLLDISWEIAKRCKGLPLAAKTLGSLLRFKNTVEQWEDILNSEIWQLESAKVDLFPHLLLSYNDLSPAQKRCFTYCAVFPKDYKIDVDDVIRKWMALGYLSTGGGNAKELELRGREYFDNLANHSLFQNFESDFPNENVIRWCKMHDIIHDFAKFLREGDLESINDRVEATILKEADSCKTCSPLLVFRIKEYRSLLLDVETDCDLHVCSYLGSVRVLKAKNMSKEIEILIHLRYLDLSFSWTKVNGNDIKTICMLYNLQTLILVRCRLGEIPSEIGNLTQLRHLDLSSNRHLKELPESIGNLHELRSLDVSDCSLSGLPEGIDGLIKLKHLSNYGKLLKNPQGLAKLTSLQTLKKFYGGNDWSKLGLLKKLNRLSGSLDLVIQVVDDLEDDIVEQAREAELRKKLHLQDLIIRFMDTMDKHTDDEVTMKRRLDIIDALEPHPNLQYLTIEKYMGSQFPKWIVSAVQQLRKITLIECNFCSSLPHLGKLPYLNELVIISVKGFQFVGREFLGITSSSSSMASSSSSSSSIGFPKLTVLTFMDCDNWKEWEDITTEEEESSTLSVMPCLMELRIYGCNSLTGLPHRLLRKASSMQRLIIDLSVQLLESYKEGPLAKFISHIPQVLIS